jgi:hypothetical protein
LLVNSSSPKRFTPTLAGGFGSAAGDWQIPLQALAEECGLQTDVGAVFADVLEYFGEVLDTSRVVNAL